MSQMPRINMDALRGILPPEDHQIACRIVNGDRLRASKPPFIRGDTWEAVKAGKVADPEGRKAAYIWRLVAFYVSPKREHQCMPVCAGFDLPFPAASLEGRALAKHLDGVVDAIVDTIPATEWHGVRRWGNAFGSIGTPRYNERGEVIYR